MKDYIYLIKVRVSSENDLYKIGRTTQNPIKRIKQYNGDTEIILIQKVTNCLEFEKDLLLEFKENFTHASEIGSEYFRGDENKMTEVIYGIHKHCKYKPRIIKTSKICNNALEGYLNSNRVEYSENYYCRQKIFIQELNEFRRENNLEIRSWNEDLYAELFNEKNIKIERRTSRPIEEGSDRLFKATWLVGVRCVS